jgi:hypothetical protein
MPDGRTVVALLPSGVNDHFGPEIKRFILAQYHQGQTTVPRLVELLRTMGMDISKRQVVRILTDGITGMKVPPDPVGIATEGALWGSILAHGFLNGTVILSDDAGQFNVGEHALCWVHAERLVHQLDTFTEAARVPKERVRTLIWWFYADLKTYREASDSRRKAALKARFDRIFKRQTGFATLDRLLTRLHANKAELLRVLDHPEIPLHTNGSENDIRCQVIRRKISGTTRSDKGRDCRDAFLGLAKTCRKLGVSFWDFLGTQSRGRRRSSRAQPPQNHRGALSSLSARGFAPVTIDIHISLLNHWDSLRLQTRRPWLA